MQENNNNDHNGSLILTWSKMSKKTATNSVLRQFWSFDTVNQAGATQVST